MKKAMWLLAILAWAAFLAGCVEVSNPDLSQVKDGTYVGEFEAWPVKAKVEVAVAGHAIQSIVLLAHRQGKGKPAEKIIETVVQKQTLEVDAVTGATLSSEVILKAVELALRQGIDAETPAPPPPAP